MGIPFSLLFFISNKMAPIYNFCSAIQNASRANLRQISLPFSNDFKSLSLVLLQEGMIDNIRPGDKHGPKSNCSSPDKIWIDLKYRQGHALINNFKTVSKPSRKIFASYDELVSLASCKSKNTLLKNPVVGAVVLVKSTYGITSLITCVEKGVGGEVLCVAS
jgi:ribosomal protein S8